MLLLENTSYENVAAFCHEGVIRSMLDIITGVKQDKTVFACDNGAVFVFEYDGNKWKVCKWNI